MAPTHDALVKLLKHEDEEWAITGINMANYAYSNNKEFLNKLVNAGNNLQKYRKYILIEDLANKVYLIDLL